MWQEPASKSSKKKHARAAEDGEDEGRAGAGAGAGAERSGEGGEGGAEPDAESAPVNKHKRYRREKPWDHDGIEHWKIEVSGGQVQSCFRHVFLSGCSSAGGCDSVAGRITTQHQAFVTWGGLRMGVGCGVWLGVSLGVWVVGCVGNWVECVVCWHVLSFLVTGVEGGLHDSPPT